MRTIALEFRLVGLVLAVAFMLAACGARSGLYESSEAGKLANEGKTPATNGREPNSDEPAPDADSRPDPARDAKVDVKALSPQFTSRPLANWMNAPALPENLLGTMWYVPDTGWDDKSELEMLYTGDGLTRDDWTPSKMVDKQETMLSLEYSAELGVFSYLTAGLHGEDRTHVVLQIPMVLSLNRNTLNNMLLLGQNYSTVAPKGHRVIIISEVRQIVGTYKQYRSIGTDVDFAGWGVKVGGKVLHSQENTNIVSELSIGYASIPPRTKAQLVEMREAIKDQLEGMDETIEAMELREILETIEERIANYQPPVSDEEFQAAMVRASAKSKEAANKE